jgi:heat shock protein HslJ
MKLASLTILSISTLLFACSNANTANTPAQASDLQQEWQLVSLDGNAVTGASSLKIDIDAQATGNLACNNFFGTLTLQDNKVRIDKMGSTRKMCEPAVNEVEMKVSSALSSWSEVQLQDKKLTLTGEVHTLVYKIK